MQILNVRTFVQRLSDWLDDFRLNRPENSKYMYTNSTWVFHPVFSTVNIVSLPGWFELYTKMVKQKLATYDYMADLDSVYKNKEGSYVYSLFKNKGDSSKNTYVFFVEVELVDQTVRSFCWPFQLKTKPIRKARTNGS